MEEKDTIIVKSITFIFKEINNLLNILSKYKAKTKITKNVQNNNSPKNNESKYIKIQKNNEFFSNKKPNNYPIDNKEIIANMIKRRKNRISQNFYENYISVNYSNYSKQPTEIDINYDDYIRKKKLKSVTNSIINNFITITNTNNNKSNKNSNHNTVRLKSNRVTRDNKKMDNFYIFKSDMCNKMKSFFHNKKTLRIDNLKMDLKTNNNSKNNTACNSKSKNKKIISKKIKQNNTSIKHFQNCLKKYNINSFENSESSINNIEKFNENLKELEIINKINISKPKLNNIISTKLISSDLIENINFNIFDYDESIGKTNTLTSIGYYIFNKYQFSNLKINQEKFENWSQKITQGYNRKNPYHSDLHAADVTQACLVYYQMGKMDNICKFDKFSVCSLFLSCMCHDFKHPGVSNHYLKESKNILAERYNDNNILENMHISETFKLINHDKNCDIFSDVDSNIYKKFRKEMILCVISTDMVFHSKHIDFMKNVLNNKNSKNLDNYENYLRLVIHSAEISNATRPFKISVKWAKLIFEEFSIQSEKEKKLGLPITFNIEKPYYLGQLSFLVEIIEPFTNLFIVIFKGLNFIDDNLKNNIKKIRDYEVKEKAKIKNTEK